MLRRRLVLAALPAAASIACPRLARAQAPARIKFNLGWKVEATAAGFLLAQQRGYYRDAGVDVAIDTGNGSAAAIGLVAGGAYDVASGDLATMIEFDVANPTARLMAVAIMYDLNPNSVIVRKSGPVAKPADLAGKTILGQPFNASRKLFPVFAKAQGYGMRSYGNGFVANPKAMQDNEAGLRAFVRGSIRGWIDAMADPKAGAAAVKAREPLANEEIEHERLRLLVDGSMKTAETKANGWGAATPARLQSTIEETVAAFGLKPGIAVADVWTDRFLPSRGERALKA